MIIPPSTISSMASITTWGGSEGRKETDEAVEQESDLNVVEKRLLVHVLPEDLGDGVEEAVQHRHQHKLVLLPAAQHVEEQVHAGGGGGGEGGGGEGGRG